MLNFHATEREADKFADAPTTSKSASENGNDDPNKNADAEASGHPNSSAKADLVKTVDPIETAAPQTLLQTKVRRARKASRAQVVRALFEKVCNQCENCGSAYALEVDHITPSAKGGTSNAENLRILCRSCNQRAAILEFGLRTIDTYLGRQ